MFTDCPILEPKSGHTKKLALLLHGVGANGPDLMTLAPYFADDPAFKDVCFMAPNGIERYNAEAERYQWFSIESLYLIPEKLSQNSIIIWQSIEQQLAAYNLGLQDLILIGFSQGAILSLFLTLTAAQPLQAVVAFAGVLVPPAKISAQAAATPICLIHGAEDQVLIADFSKQAESILKSYQFQVTSHIIPHLAHTIDQKGLDHARQFLKTHISKLA